MLRFRATITFIFFKANYPSVNLEWVFIFTVIIFDVASEVLTDWTKEKKKLKENGSTKT